MNPDLPLTPRQELESRLTAMLLGETSAEEAATLDAILKIDPELRMAHDRLLVTIGLVREAAPASPTPMAASPESPKLSEQRRQKLLASFRTVAPPQFRQRPRRQTSWWLATAAAAAVVVLLGGLMLPAFSTAKSKGQRVATVRTTEELGLPSVSRRANVVGGDELHRLAMRPTAPPQPTAGVPLSAPLKPGSSEGTVSSVEIALPKLQTVVAGRSLADVAGQSDGMVDFKLSDSATRSVDHFNFTPTKAIDAPVGINAGAEADDLRKRSGEGANELLVVNGSVSSSGKRLLMNRAAGTSESQGVTRYGLAISGGGGGGGFGGGGGGGPVADQSAAVQLKADAKVTLDDTELAITHGEKNAEVAQVVTAVADTPAVSFSVPVQAITPLSALAAPPAAPRPTAAIAGKPVAQVPSLGDTPTTGFYFRTEVADESRAKSKDSLDRSDLARGLGRRQLEERAPATNLGALDVDRASRQEARVGGIPTLGEAQFGEALVDLNGRLENLKDTNAKGAAWGDFDNAGNLDLFVNKAPVTQASEPEAKKLRELSAADKSKAASTKQWFLALADPEAKPAINQPAEVEKLAELKEETLARKQLSPPPVPQPEVQVMENPFSTFSLNVSDVSFKLAAASLEQGKLPDAASIRSEEFINAFDYRDPEPGPGMPIAFAHERARYPFAQNRDVLRLSVKTAAEGRQAGKPISLVLLLDNSGSMERADRVRTIREALRVLAGQLQPQDKLSVVLFARTARLVIDGVSGANAQAIAEEISNVTPDGGTNLGEALDVAYQTALRHYTAAGINRVVLLTDGAANLGEVNADALKQKVESHRQRGIALDCFGVGWEGFNDDLLEVLSRNGDGRYGFINTPEEAATEFVGQLAGALRVAASDVKVQVEFNPARVNAYRQIGYAKHQLKKEQFRDNTVDAAEIGAAEAGNALYVIEANPQGQGPIATVRVRYKVPGTADYHEHEWAVPFTGNAPALEQSSSALRLAGAASAFSEWLASSPYAGDVTLDKLTGLVNGLPEAYSPDPRPARLEWMLRQAKSLSGK